ncbi:adhesion G protein-coupled receptor L2-like isoform X1 [Haliotis asinina]|uniref:adhesion G protein-coupled receptor L2-like isoform X1 n=1 Tax=Haliotis asinina TaxID=109174 RepID=UPI0035325B6A
MSCSAVLVLLALVLIWHGAVSWECPVAREVRGHQCRSDRDCTSDGKCCAIDHTYSCWSLVQYNRDMLNCPAHTEIQPTSCYNGCWTDSDCQGGRKCCQSHTDCGLTCYPPIKYEKVKAVICPAPSDPRDFRCHYPCHSDADCLNMGRCCNFPCGKSCWWSPVEAFITATVRGDCSYQENAAIGEEDVRLSCQLRVNSTTPVQVEWYKGRTSLPNGRGRVHSMKTCKDRDCRSLETHLMFDRIQSDDAGTYTMIVTSGREKYGHAVNLTIFNSPEIEIHPSLSTVYSGDKVDLTCRIVNLDKTNPYYKTGIKLKWCHRGLSNANNNGIHYHGFGEETIRLTNVSGDVVIGCGLNSTDCTVTAEVKVLPNADRGCPVSVDIRRYKWPWTPASKSMVAPCPVGYSGRASRLCSDVSTWFYPNYYRCVSHRISHVDSELRKMKTGALSANYITPVLVQLDTAATELNLTGGDIGGIVSSISDIIILVKVTRRKLGEEGRESFINVVNSALAKGNLQEWNIILKEALNQSTVSSLLRSVSDFGLLTADEHAINDDPAHMVKETILFGAGKTSPEDIVFPEDTNDEHAGVPRYRRSNRESTSVAVQKATLVNLMDGPTDEIKWTYSIYKTLPDIMNLDGHSESIRSVSFTERERVKVVSDIVSFMVKSKEGAELHPPIRARMYMRIQEDETSLNTDTHKMCGRFIPIEGSNTSSWVSAGCQLVVDSSGVVCECSRLGHIAVLTVEQVTPKIQPLFLTLLKAICSVPLLGALIIIIVGIKRRAMTGSTALSLNVCGAIVGAYTVFAVGIDMTKDEGLCLGVGIALHFLFTVMTLGMFAQTVYQGIIFTRHLTSFVVHTSKWLYLFLVIAVWVVGAGIVAATALVASLESYSTTRLCWVNTRRDAALSLLGTTALALLLHVGVLILCACAGRCNPSEGNVEEKVPMQSGVPMKKYLDVDTQHTRKHILLKQGFRTVMLVLDLCAEIMLVLMVTTHVHGNTLEYVFAVCTVLKAIILVCVDAYLVDTDTSSNQGKADGTAVENIYEEVLNVNQRTPRS